MPVDVFALDPVTRWLRLDNAAFSSTTQFTCEGHSTLVTMMPGKLLFCTDVTGATRRYGYVKTATEASGVITVDCVMTSDLVSTDINFNIDLYSDVMLYCERIYINGDIDGNAVPQGNPILDVKRARYILPADFAMRTSAGPGGDISINIKVDDTTDIYPVDLHFYTATELQEQRPSVSTLSAGANLSLYVTGSSYGGSAPRDLQARMYLVPQHLFTNL
jgi:hypothetical protein